MVNKTMEVCFIFCYCCYLLLMKYNCFMMLCFCCSTEWISCMYTYSPSLLSLPPTHPHSTPWVITEHLTELTVPYSHFPLALHSARGCVYVSVLLSQCVLHSCPPSPCSHVHPVCLHLCPCLVNRFICTIFYILHICINIWYLFFWLTSLCMTDFRSIHITIDDPVSFIFMAE